MGFWQTVGKYALQFAEYSLEQKFAAKSQVLPVPTAPVAAPPAAAPPAPTAAPVVLEPVDPLASIRQFVIDTYCHGAPAGLNRANVHDISPIELQDGIEKVQKHGTHGLLREMYTRNGIHDDQMPPELLIDNPA